MAIGKLHVKAPLFWLQHSAAVVASWVGPWGVGPCFFLLFCLWANPRRKKTVTDTYLGVNEKPRLNSLWCKCAATRHGVVHSNMESLWKSGLHCKLWTNTYIRFQLTQMYPHETYYLVKQCLQQSILDEARWSESNHEFTWSVKISLFHDNSFIAPNCYGFAAEAILFN